MSFHQQMYNVEPQQQQQQSAPAQIEAVQKGKGKAKGVDPHAPTFQPTTVSYQQPAPALVDQPAFAAPVVTPGSWGAFDPNAPYSDVQRLSVPRTSRKPYQPWCNLLTHRIRLVLTDQLSRPRSSGRIFPKSARLAIIWTAHRPSPATITKASLPDQPPEVRAVIRDEPVVNSLQNRRKFQSWQAGKERLESHNAILLEGVFSVLTLGKLLLPELWEGDSPSKGLSQIMNSFVIMSFTYPWEFFQLVSALLPMPLESFRAVQRAVEKQQRDSAPSQSPSELAQSNGLLQPPLPPHPPPDVPLPPPTTEGAPSTASPAGIPPFPQWPFPGAPGSAGFLSPGAMPMSMVGPGGMFPPFPFSPTQSFPPFAQASNFNVNHNNSLPNNSTSHTSSPGQPTIPSAAPTSTKPSKATKTAAPKASRCEERWNSLLDRHSFCSRLGLPSLFS